MPPNGTICASVTRERGLDPQVLAATEERLVQEVHVAAPVTALRRRSRRFAHDPRLDSGPPGAPGPGAVELVGRDHDRPPLPRRGGDEEVELRPVDLVEAGVGLVEQEELRVAVEGDGEGQAAALTRGQAAVPDVFEAVSPKRASAAVAPRSGRPDARAAKRRFSATVRSS